MAKLNKVLLIGNLTRDVELAMTNGGTPVSTIGLAVNDVYHDREGNRNETVLFVDVTVFGRTAEACSTYIGKGSLVFVEGRMRRDEFTDRDGKPRSKLRITAESVQFLDRKGGDE